MSFERICIAIDFGTTQTTATYYDYQQSKPIIIKNSHGNDFFRSALLFKSISKGEVLFGNEIANTEILFEKKENYITEMKRFIGRKYLDVINTPEDKQRLAMYSIHENENGDIKINIKIKNENEENCISLLPQQLVAIQLNKLKTIVDKIMNQNEYSDKITDYDVVVSFPVSFDENQKLALKRAYEIAGFNVKTMITEPSAAILHYIKETNDKFDKCVLVDIGGGTTDVVVCERKPNGDIKVLGSSGDQECGGSDLDYIIVKMVKQYLIDNRVETSVFEYDERQYEDKTKRFKEQMKKNVESFNSRLKYLSENAKIKMTVDEYTSILSIELFKDENGYSMNEIVIQRENFEENVRESGFLKHITDCINHAMLKASVEKKDIDRVILVGGTTKVPIVKNHIAKLLGEEKMTQKTNYDPMTAVAQGSCLYCIESKDKINIYTDLQKSINLVLANGKVFKLIPKGTRLPFALTSWGPFKTSRNNQTEVIFKLSEGESKFADFNDPLISYKATNLSTFETTQLQFNIKIEINNLGELRFFVEEINSQNQIVEMNVRLTYDLTENEVKEMKTKIWNFLDN